MKKVGILTINDNNNIGNRLQNYATQEFLKELGFEAETIQNYIYYTKFYKIKFVLRRMLRSILDHKKFKKENIFLEFNKNYVNISKTIISYRHIPKKINEKYDFFVTGSDQVWNPNFERMSDVDFLTFADKEKRISMSASFGISSIPDDLKEYYRKRLQEFKRISVREENGKEIVEELTNRKDVVVLLDPTMLVSADKWNNVMKKPKNWDKLKNKKYIFNFFLGKQSDKIKLEIEKIAKENNCEIINIRDENDMFYLSGPSEFLYLIYNAFFICTNSFHASVFSILFNKPFVVFDRDHSKCKMNSRIDTLLKKFNVEDRWWDGEIKEEQLNVNYKINDVLENERKKAKLFIEESMK